jgi:hypothetical protein
MQRKGNREMPPKEKPTMKRITALAFLAATLISMSSACAHAQAIGFSVPFDFTVSHQVFPAGTYRVSYMTKNAIVVRSSNGRLSALSTTHGADDQSTGGCVLVFSRYGNQYFLHQVLCGNAAMKAELPTSTLEKQVRLQRAQLPRSQTVAALDVRAK